jgi:hypothetical protein
MSHTKALYINRITSISSGLAGAGTKRAAAPPSLSPQQSKRPGGQGNDGSTHHLSQVNALMKMSLRTQTATVMVLDRNSTNYAFNFCGAESILVEMLSCDHTYSTSAVQCAVLRVLG